MPLPKLFLLSAVPPCDCALSFHRRCKALRLCNQMDCVEHVVAQVHEEKSPEKDAYLLSWLFCKLKAL